MNIKYAVLCSEGNIDRTLNVKKLTEQLPELIVIFANRENVFNKHLSLFELGKSCNGIVILEDDVKLCRNFKEKCEKLISERPNELISMFESACSKKELHSEYRAGARFAWNQCNYYPAKICTLLADTSIIPDFTKYFYEKFNEPWNYPIDRYIAYVLSINGLKYWMQVPFLVQHLPLQSNFKGRPLNRQSRFFIDDIERKNVRN